MKHFRLISILLLTLVSTVHAGEVSVAVAANFTTPMKQIAQAFEKDTGHKLTLAYGATGKFYAQIKNGAPFDVLLAADNTTPAKLISENAAIAGSQFTYAMGKLVLWSAKPAIVDQGGQVLKNGGFDHIAIANPKVAPYGAAALEVMKSLGVHDALQSKMVTGENIAQTQQFIHSGSALLGFIALSQVLKDGKIEGSAWIVPSKLYTPILQDVVVLQKGKDKPAATDFLKYLQTKKAQTIITSFGYELP